MKIKVLCVSVLLAFSSIIVAQQDGDTIALNIDESITQPQQQQSWWNKKLLHKGYKGHLEFFTEPIDDNMYLLGVSTSHGRQFSPQFFLGGGMSFIFLEYYYDKSRSKAELHGTIPLIVSFADFRFTPITKRITPVVGLKMGYLFFFHFLRATPYIGVRWGLCKEFGANLGVGFPVFFMPFGEGTMEAVRLNVGIDF